MSYFDCGYDKKSNLKDWNKIDNLEEKERQRLLFNFWKLITASHSDLFQKNGTLELCFYANRYFHDKICPNKCRSINCEHFKDIFDFNVPFGSKPNHFNDMQEFLATFDFRLIVVDSKNIGNFLYDGRPRNWQWFKTVYIECIMNKDGGHFNWIKSMTGYQENKYFCRFCLSGHYDLVHKCTYLCDVCHNFGACEPVNRVDCDICKRTFYNEKCLQNHFDQGFGCIKAKYCENCEIKFTGKHKCNEFVCNFCSEKYTIAPHYCMLKPLSIDKLTKEDSINKIIVIFDIESTLIGQSNNVEHIPNLLIASKLIIF
jgi:hypothetical protein